jgi:RNA polymerase sigma-70 factor (ECF subfamily)
MHMETSAVSADADDLTLVDAARDGDHDAFTALVNRHGGKVRGVAWRVLGNADDAEDAAQEAFVRAYRALPKFRGQSSFASWIHRITLNVCHDMLRARRARYADAPLTEVAEESLRDPDHYSDPQRVVLGAEFRSELSAALEHIHPSYRTAILLHDQDGLTISRIAQLTAVPVPTAKARLRRGRMQLATLLEDGYAAA